MSAVDQLSQTLVKNYLTCGGDLVFLSGGNLYKALQFI